MFYERLLALVLLVLVLLRKKVVTLQNFMTMAAPIVGKPPFDRVIHGIPDEMLERSFGHRNPEKLTQLAPRSRAGMDDPVSTKLHPVLPRNTG